MWLNRDPAVMPHLYLRLKEMLIMKAINNIVKISKSILSIRQTIKHSPFYIIHSLFKVFPVLFCIGPSNCRLFFIIIFAIPVNVYDW